MSAAGIKKRLRLLMQRSAYEIEVVECCLNLGFLNVAASRCYFSVFYAATAIMLERGMEFDKHKKLFVAFGKEFGRSDKNGGIMYRILVALFETRMDADYRLRDIKKRDLKNNLKEIMKFHEWAKAQLPSLNEDER